MSAVRSLYPQLASPKAVPILDLASGLWGSRIDKRCVALIGLLGRSNPCDHSTMIGLQVAKSAGDKGALSAVGQGRHLPRSESVRVVPHALDDLRAVTRRFLIRSRGYSSGVGRARDHHLQCLMRTLLVVEGDPISDTKLALNGGDCSLQLILAALQLCKRIRLLLRCAVPQGGDIPVKGGDYYLHYQDQLLEKLLKLLIDFRRNCRDDDP